MKSINIEEIKSIQQEILNVVADYCRKKDLRYFLCGGTLIGAVRHQGYIPWDDDIDVALLRSDYDKFVTYFNGKNDLYRVYTSSNADWYPYPFAKVSFENSVLKEATDNMPFKIGVNIDVFPIDTVPENSKLQRKLIKDIRLQRNILEIKSIVINRKRPFYKNAILKVGKLFLKYTKPKMLVSNIINKAIQYKNYQTNKLGIIVWGYGECEIVSKNIFEDVVSMEFEGRYYDVPIGYHDWLSSVYGNYIELPPLEKQVSHHAFLAFLKE